MKCATIVLCASHLADIATWVAAVTEKHFKEKLSRVLGLGNTTPDAAAMTTSVRGLMFGDYMIPGDHLCSMMTPTSSSHL